ncbi:MAG TPA: DUF1294 domain-containing protein [Clostridia bacterium]|nr:DUF1294 domain-containing protein [Clostridia bacterium]
MIDAERALLFLGIWLTAVSAFAALLTLYDKRAARRGARRIRERTLLLVCVFGGSVAMLATMRIIRHKTKHAKFMVGIPVIIVGQTAIGVLVWWRLP